MFEILRKFFGIGEPVRPAPVARFGIEDLARRLEMPVVQLRAVRIQYRQFDVPKRSGGRRVILAPEPELKKVQRRILHCLLGRLRAHPCATGFERGHSIVTHALPHVGRDVVVRLDIQDFFASTSAGCVEAYFRAIGWDAESATLLTNLCTHQDALPQGAPTSPRLSNLMNYRLDARIHALAAARGVSYSRYADDMTLSWSRREQHTVQRTNPKTLEELSTNTRANDLIHLIKQIVADEGYRLHTNKKLRIARRHDRQLVTGLVVNQRVNLPRSTRRRLRAAAHHLATGRPATLTAKQLEGWQALRKMIATQAGESQPR